ncbi:MAG: 5'-methylthioadenosine/S-adenosylhomocysteine nucleosidase [Anaerolineales bacterium]|nr:5'-methylthioadenosine/S-adenosylhomocysteine nucleosidase [Anaerolineales bacterium]
MTHKLAEIVVLVSANSEWRVVKTFFPNAVIQHSPCGHFFNTRLNLKPITFFHGGWGKVSAAASAQYVIDHFQPDLLVNLGTCGGFEGCVDAGTIILVERTIIYDIYEQMSDAASAIDFYATDLDLSWLPPVDDLPIRRGILVSGDRDILPEDIPMLIQRYAAFAADWETGAIAWVAQKNGSRLLVLRGVSDLVNTHGGEAYGNVNLYHTRTDEIMRSIWMFFTEILKRLV